MAISEFHLPFTYYLSLFSRSLKPLLHLALASQPLALNCTSLLNRSKPVTNSLSNKCNIPEAVHQQKLFLHPVRPMCVWRSGCSKRQPLLWTWRLQDVASGRQHLWLAMSKCHPELYRLRRLCPEAFHGWVLGFRLPSIRSPQVVIQSVS